MQLRIPSIPNDLLPGQRIELEIESIDLLAPEMTCRFVRLLDVPAVAEVLAEDSL
jgi:exoribonuclease-2